LYTLTSRFIGAGIDVGEAVNVCVIVGLSV
jgi:hypothetical protein